MFCGHVCNYINGSVYTHLQDLTQNNQHCSTLHTSRNIVAFKRYFTKLKRAYLQLVSNAKSAKQNE